jgi:hypothetical protein
MTYTSLTRRACFVLVASALLLVSRLSFAGNTWDGGGSSDNWGNSVNWSSDTLPAFGTLTFSGTTRTTNINTLFTSGGVVTSGSVGSGTLNMNQLNFTGTSAWTISGNPISLFDNSGTQSKVENNSTGLLTINLPIRYASTNASNPFGELNAIGADISFGSTATLTVDGSQVNGIKFFGSGHVINFNNTVSATGKWFGMTTSGVGNTVNVNGSFTSSDFYVMNGGTLNLNSGGSLNFDTGKGVRLGGDFGTTGNQNLTKSGTFNLTNAAGGQTFGGVINSVLNNTSGALAVNSQNTSNTNTLSGHVALDSNLTITQAAGGTLAITQQFTDPGVFKTGTDIKGNTLTLTGGGSTSLINLSGDIYNSTGSGKVVVGGTGTVVFSGTNTYGGTTTVSGGTLLVNGNQSTAAGAVSVSGTLGGIGTIGGATTVNSAGVITGGTNGTTGTLSFNNQNLVVSSNGKYVVDTSGASSSDLLALGTGILDLSASGDILSFNTPITPLTGTSYTLATFASHNGTFDSVLNTPAGYQVDYTGTSLLLDQVAAVPEPSTWVAGAIVAAALLVTQRRKLFELVCN